MSPVKYVILAFVLCSTLALRTPPMVKKIIRPLGGISSVVLRDSNSFDTVVDVSSKYEADCSLVADSGISLSTYMRLPVDQYVCIKVAADP